MCKSMPVLMDIVLLTVIRVLSINLQDSKTALSVYLKNSAARSSAKKHRAVLNPNQIQTGSSSRLVEDLLSNVNGGYEILPAGEEDVMISDDELH